MMFESERDPGTEITNVDATACLAFNPQGTFLAMVMTQEGATHALDTNGTELWELWDGDRRRAIHRTDLASRAMGKDGSIYFGTRYPPDPREQENLSAGLLGSGSLAYAFGLAGESPLWYGYGSLQSGLSVGSLNLSADAVIPNAPVPEAWATNELGDVLWLYKEYAGGSYRYNLWLSTLVPEPSLLTVLSLLAMAAPSAVASSGRDRRRDCGLPSVSGA